MKTVITLMLSVCGCLALMATTAQAATTTSSQRAAHADWSPIIPDNPIATQDKLSLVEDPDFYENTATEFWDFSGGFLVLDSQKSDYRHIYAEIEVTDHLELPSSPQITQVIDGVEIFASQLENGNLGVEIIFSEGFDTSLDDYGWGDAWIEAVPGIRLARIGLTRSPGFNVYNSPADVGSAIVKNVIAVDQSGQQYSFLQTVNSFWVTSLPHYNEESSEPICATSINIPQGITMTINATWNQEEAQEYADWLWESSNYNIVKVIDNSYDGSCTIQTLSPGTATVTASAITEGLLEGWPLTIYSMPKKFVINVTEAAVSVEPCDVNGDGDVNASDITIIYNKLLGQ